MLRRLIHLFIFITAIGLLPAEELFPVRSFRSFERANWPELPQNTINDLVQDKRGVLWIGTLDGVATFDGQRLKRIEDMPFAPSKGLILSIACDQAGNVFVATNLGLHRYDYRKWLLIDTQAPMMKLIADSKGRLWGQKLGNELFLLEEKNGTPVWVKPPAPLPGSCQNFFPYDDENIYYTVDNRVYQWDGREIKEICPGQKLDGNLSAFFVSREGRLFAGTDRGNFYTELKNEKKWQEIVINNWQGGGLRRIVQDQEGTIWISGYRKDLICGNFEKGWQVWTKDNGLKDTGILSLLVDREQTLWIGYNGMGLHQLLSREWRHRVSANESSRDTKPFNVFGISKRLNGGFLVAVFSQGVLSWEGKKVEFFDETHNLVADVRHAVEPEPGIIWAACRFGIYEKRGSRKFTKVYEIPRGFATYFLSLPSGDWLCATSNRGFLIKKDSEGWQEAREINSQLPDPQIRAVAVCNRNRLWVATLRGITIFNDTVAIEQLNYADNPLLPQNVNAISQMKSGEIWLGGSDGIAIYDQGKWQRLSEIDRLPGSTIYAIGENPENGEIWVTGSEGVSRKTGTRWTHYSLKNGLIEEECNRGGLLIDPDGSVLVGTMRSLAFFQPDRSESEEVFGAQTFWLSIPDFRTDKQRLIHSARPSTLSFSWHTPYLRPHQVYYQVRANKVSEKLLDLKDANSLLLSRPAPGRWEIEVLTRIDDGENIVDCKPVKLSFFIKPLFTETSFFKIIIVLIALAASGLIFLWRIGIIKKRNAMLDLLVAQKTEELNLSNRQLQELNDQLTRLAYADPLTGLLNRRVIEERLGEYLALMERQKKPLSVLLFDLDNLKQINDTFGHEIGDLALKNTAYCMKKTFRETDLMARFGGDEFMVICPDTDEIGIKIALERFIKNLAESRIKAGKEVELTASVSGGVISLIPDRSTHPEQILNKIDRALYRAKASGRNQIFPAE